MANTAWKTLPASEKQVRLVTNLADEKVVSGLHDELLDRLADVASGVEISGGEISALIDALFAAPRKAKPSAGFAPLVSNRAERLAEAVKSAAEAVRFRTEADAAKAVAGGTTYDGYCTKCNHRHADVKCLASIQHWDDYWPCECEATERGTAATQAAAKLAAEAAGHEKYAQEDQAAADAFQRGDEVVVARGRKITKGSKGQIIKVDYEGRYGASVFLLLDGGDKVWTALKNIDHEEV